MNEQGFCGSEGYRWLEEYGQKYWNNFKEAVIFPARRVALSASTLKILASK